MDAPAVNCVEVVCHDAIDVASSVWHCVRSEGVWSLTLEEGMLSQGM